MTGIKGLAALSVIARPEASLNCAAEASHCTGRDDSFGSASNPGEKINTGTWSRGHNGAGYVTVGNEFNSGTRLADIVHKFFVPGAIKYANGQVCDALAFALC
jgi:hypothetical protein